MVGFCCKLFVWSPLERREALAISFFEGELVSEELGVGSKGNGSGMQVKV